MELILRARKLSLKRKLGMIFMFPVRWLLLALSFFMGIYSPLLAVWFPVDQWGSGIGFLLRNRFGEWPSPPTCRTPFLPYPTIDPPPHSPPPKTAGY